VKEIKSIKQAKEYITKQKKKLSKEQEDKKKTQDIILKEELKEEQKLLKTNLFDIFKKRDTILQQLISVESEKDLLNVDRIEEIDGFYDKYVVKNNILIEALCIKGADLSKIEDILLVLRKKEDLQRLDLYLAKIGSKELTKARTALTKTIKNIKIYNNRLEDIKKTFNKKKDVLVRDVAATLKLKDYNYDNKLGVIEDIEVFNEELTEQIIKQPVKYKEINDLTLNEIEPDINDLTLNEIVEEPDINDLTLNEIEPDINDLTLNEIVEEPDINDLTLNEIEEEIIDIDNEKFSIYDWREDDYIDIDLERFKFEKNTSKDKIKTIKQILTEIRDFFINEKEGIKSLKIEKPDILKLNEFFKVILSGVPIEYNAVLYVQSKTRNLHYTLNMRNRERLKNMIVKDFTVYKDSSNFKENTFSDAQLIEYLMEFEKIILKIPSYDKPINVNDTKTGGFFKYYNNTDIDLSKYQIFKLDDPLEDYHDCCLVYALLKQGLSQSKYGKIKSFVKNREIPECKFKEIAEILKIKIELKTRKYSKKNESNYTFTQTFGESKKTYHIGNIDNHYFFNEKTIYSSYSIKHYDEVKHLKDFHQIVDKTGNKNNTGKLNSYDLINTLFNNKEKHFIKMNQSNLNVVNSQFYNEINIIPDGPIMVEDYDCRLLKRNKVTKLAEKVIKEGKEALKEVINNLEGLEYEIIEEEEEKEEEEKDDFQNVFFDVETYKKLIKVSNDLTTDKDFLLQNPFIVCCIFDEITKKNKLNIKYKELDYNCFTGKACIKQFLSSLPHCTRLIAHNAGFDFNFLMKHLYGVQLCKKDGRFIKLTGFFNQNRIEIRDSYLYLNFKLSKFNKLFKIEAKKEIMPYNLLTHENITKKYVNINLALKELKEEDHAEFLDNLNQWNCRLNTEFDIVLYSKIYCLQDCRVLQQGYNTFKSWCMDDFNLNIDKICTISSFVHIHFIKSCVYDNVYELSGIPNLFISKCIIGGKTATNKNKQYYYKKNIEEGRHGIADQDINALYLASSARLGFLKGKPKTIIDTRYNSISKHDGYFVEIKIKNLNKTLDFPLLSIIEPKTGVRTWTDDLKIVKENIFYLDKIALEDLINFYEIKEEKYDIDFEIIRGLYFDEGFNYEIQTQANKLFDKRLQKKKNKDPTQLLYKSMSVSSYGKTILKEINTKEVIHYNSKKEQKAQKFLDKNYNIIHSYVENYQNTNNWLFKVYKMTNVHFSMPHIGCSILSMSKRIVNQITLLSQELNVKIYYIDTDSLHIELKGYLELKEKYFIKYKRHLEGELLGQVMSDFEMKDENGNDCINIHSILTIILGKKSYLHYLEGTKPNGEKQYDYHLRMKGAGESGIYDIVKSFNEDEELRKIYNITEKTITPIKIYEMLYEGHNIAFDLTEDGEKLKLKIHKDYTVETVTEFGRIMSFKRNRENDIDKVEHDEELTVNKENLTDYLLNKTIKKRKNMRTTFSYDEEEAYFS